MIGALLGYNYEIIGVNDGWKLIHAEVLVGHGAWGELLEYMQDLCVE